MNHWNDILANNDLKSYLRGLVRLSRTPANLSERNTLVVGPSRTGKTSTLLFAIKAMFCVATDTTSDEPCNACEVCKTLEKEGVVDRGLLAHPGVLDRGLLYASFDGNRITREDLSRKILEAQQEWNYRHLFYIDEIQGLVRRGLDHDLLNPLEAIRNITWIVSTATTKGLEPMFRNRLHQVRTELPSARELARFLCRKCLQPGSELKWEDDGVFYLLAKRSHRVVGTAIKCLRSAQVHGVLTRRYVEDYHFEPLIEDE